LDSRAPAGFAALQQLLARKTSSAPGERCDFCATPIESEHSHLIELAARRILCTCRPCYIVFEPRGAAQGRYKTVPSRYAAVDGFALDAAQWDDLGIPIGLAFFFFNSLDGKMVAFYPGPAGATESLLSLAGWDAILSANLALATLEADVEAVLIDRRSGQQRCFIVPIDAAYELVGLIRTTWRGFDGGDEAHRRIDEFFATVVERSRGRVTARLR
jgi:hypothetical protein